MSDAAPKTAATGDATSHDGGAQRAGSAMNLYAATGHNTDATSTATTGASPVASSPIDAGKIGSISVWLGVVICVILAGSYLFKRFVGFRDQAGNVIHVVASRSVGQRERIAVVDVNGRRLTLGITGHSITQLDAQPAPHPTEDRPAPTSNTPPSFKQALAINLRRAAGRGRKS